MARAMKNKTPLIVLLTLSLTVSLAASVAIASDGWRSYRSSDYGFSMLVPEGAKIVEREASGGWGGLYAESDGVALYGLAKLGSTASASEIEAFAVKTTRIPEGKWRKIDEGKGDNGFRWYRVYEAEHGGRLVFGAAGTGPKGAYLLFLETTTEDYAAHKSAYRKWYDSVKVF